MKRTFKLAALLIAFSVTFTACKKEEPTSSGGENPSNPTSPTSTTIMATGDFNYLNDGGNYAFKGVNYILNDNGQAGIIINDSTLDIKFKDQSSDRTFLFRMEGQTIPVEVGTYDLSTPFNSSSPYRLVFTGGGTNLPLFFDANSSVDGVYYNNQPVVKYGELVISSLTTNQITGTVNCDIYSGQDYSNNVLNYTNKLEVRNLSFSGSYKRVN